jgi:hypothetical protein
MMKATRKSRKLRKEIGRSRWVMEEAADKAQAATEAHHEVLVSKRKKVWDEVAAQLADHVVPDDAEMPIQSMLYANTYGNSTITMWPAARNYMAVIFSGTCTMVGKLNSGGIDWPVVFDEVKDLNIINMVCREELSDIDMINELDLVKKKIDIPRIERFLTTCVTVKERITPSLSVYVQNETECIAETPVHCVVFVPFLIQDDVTSRFFDDAADQEIGTYFTDEENVGTRNQLLGTYLVPGVCKATMCFNHEE